MDISDDFCSARVLIFVLEGSELDDRVFMASAPEDKLGMEEQSCVLTG